MEAQDERLELGGLARGGLFFCFCLFCDEREIEGGRVGVLALRARKEEICVFLSLTRPTSAWRALSEEQSHGVSSAPPPRRASLSPPRRRG